MKYLLKILLIVIIASCLSWVCRKYFFQYYVVPTPSMMSTISSGEGLIIRKCFRGFNDGKGGISSSIGIARKDILVFEHPRQSGLVLVKRCIGMPGDSLLLFHNMVYINGQFDAEPEGARFTYLVKWTTVGAYNFVKDHFATNREEYLSQKAFIVSLTKADAFLLRKREGITMVDRLYANGTDKTVFPGDGLHQWNRDNFGPVLIPKKNMVLSITPENINIYKSALSEDGGNLIKVVQNRIYVNGIQVHKYKFKSNFYFMMGDNRHDSIDSRYWGFVPEAKIVGKAIYKITGSGLLPFQ